jgi:hypothetical protein
MNIPTAEPDQTPPRIPGDRAQQIVDMLKVATEAARLDVIHNLAPGRGDDYRDAVHVWGVLDTLTDAAQRIAWS